MEDNLIYDNCHLSVGESLSAPLFFILCLITSFHVFVD